MNVLIVNPNVWMGGAQKVLVQEAIELQRLGHRVCILTTRADLAERPDLAAQLTVRLVDIPILEFASGRYTPIRGKTRLLRRLLRLRAAVRSAVVEGGIEIINAHHPPMHWVCAGLDVPLVWTCHEPISLWPTRKPYFVLGDTQRLTAAGRAARVAFERLDPAIVRRGVRRVIAVSEGVRDDVRALYGIEASVIHSPIDTEAMGRAHAASARVRYGLRDRFVVTQVGHLTAVKNQICSVEAVREAADAVPGLVLLLVGEGPDEPMLREYVSRHGLNDRVRFLGRLSDAEVADCLAASDLLLLPARKQTWGLVAFEALACGALPLVANDCGARHVLAAHDIGLLVDPTPHGFAQRILFAHGNRDLCRTMAARGRRFAMDTLGYAAYARRVERCLREVLDSAAC